LTKERRAASTRRRSNKKEDLPIISLLQQRQARQQSTLKYIKNQNDQTIKNDVHYSTPSSKQGERKCGGQENHEEKGKGKRYKEEEG